MDGGSVCEHVAAIRDVTPGAEGCEECLSTGQRWVHLRLCLTCGHVGCCNESPNRHAERHYAETGHPVMRSFEPCEDWMWCYADDALVQDTAVRRSNPAVTREALHGLPLFSALSDEDLDRLHGMAKPVFIPAGTVLMRQGEPGDELYVILEGALEVTKETGEGEVVLGLRRTGEVIGEMAVLEDAPRSATVRAAEDCLLLSVSKAALETLLACSPSATLSILRTMTSRLRSQQAVLTQQEKMAALGTLSAGLAHELNNPAAAIQRSVRHLGEVVSAWDGMALEMGKLGLGREQIDSLRSMQEEVAASSRRLDPLARSEQEDILAEWLEDHDLPEPWDLAPVLVAAGWDEARLEELVGQFRPDQRAFVVRLVATRASALELLGEVQRSGEAISKIVRGVKTYSHLDEAPVDDVDVHQGLEDTLSMLKHKLKTGVSVHREYASALPHIEAYGSELNQVWTNLIDNAIDAMGGNGDLTLRTRATDDAVVVEIEDNGPGIPPEMQSRIYDAFFTTKPPGVGSGLGLHIVYNIVVDKHRGRLRLHSEPGRTRFEVEVPARLQRR